MPSIVQVSKLSKQYDPPRGAVALKGVSFTIEQGEIFSLLGPNGAGKTTLIAMLSCLLAPSGGDALIDGHSIVAGKPALKRAIGVVPQDIALYPMISARENLLFWGRLYGLRGQQLRQRVAAVLDGVGLSEQAAARVDSFSGGMKRRLNIAAGLLHTPKVLYLDEPTVGVDPQSRRRILDMVKALNREGMTVLYTTHYMEEAEELSHRIGIIDQGELVALGTPDELRRMVGEHSAVRLELEQPGELSERLAAAYGALPQVERVSCDDGALLLETRDANAALPALLACAFQQGAQIRRLEIREPNLETVFLHLTGRALRD